MMNKYQLVLVAVFFVGLGIGLYMGLSSHKSNNLPVAQNELDPIDVYNLKRVGLHQQNVEHGSKGDRRLVLKPNNQPQSIVSLPSDIEAPGVLAPPEQTDPELVENLQQDIENTVNAMQTLGDSDEDIANRVAELQEMAAFKKNAPSPDLNLGIEATPEEISNQLGDALAAANVSQEEINMQQDLYWQSLIDSKMEITDVQ